MNWAEDFPNSSHAEKKVFKKSRYRQGKRWFVEVKRSKTSSGGVTAASSPRKVGRLLQETKKGNVHDSAPSCAMTISDHKASLEVTGRCDDGSGENTASSELDKRAVINGIGKIEAIDTVHIEVALTKQDEPPAKYSFSKPSSVPIKVMHLNSG